MKLIFTLLLSFTLLAGLAQVSIHDIQYTTSPDGNSPYNNQIVTTVGKVIKTVTAGENTGYFIQDGTGAWNGLFVYDCSGMFELWENQIYTFTGRVEEMDGLTTLTNITNFNESGTVDSIVPQTISTNQFGEAYESVLVRFDNVLCTQANAGDGYYLIKSQGTEQTVKVVDFIFNPQLLQAQHYNITGLGYYYDGEFLLCPRDENDIEEINSIEKILVSPSIALYPNPCVHTINIKIDSFGNNTIKIFDTKGKLVLKQAAYGNETCINVEDFSEGLYFVNIYNELTHKNINSTFIKKN